MKSPDLISPIHGNESVRGYLNREFLSIFNHDYRYAIDCTRCAPQGSSDFLNTTKISSTIWLHQRTSRLCVFCVLARSIRHSSLRWCEIELNVILFMWPSACINIYIVWLLDELLERNSTNHSDRLHRQTVYSFSVWLMFTQMQNHLNWTHIVSSSSSSDWESRHFVRSAIG